MAKEFDQNWLWSFVALQFMRYDGDVSASATLIAASRVLEYRFSEKTMNF